MKTFKRLFAYIRYRKLSFFIGFIFQVISAGLNIYTPMIGQQFIDYVAYNYRNHLEIEMSVILRLISWFVLCALLGALASYISYMILAYAANALSKRIRDEAHEHMQKLPVSYFDDKPAGKISARIVNDTEALRQGFFMNISIDILINGLFIIGVYIAFFYIDAKIGIAFLFVIPILLIWQWWYMKTAEPINHRWRESISDLNSHTAEIVQGVSIVQVFNRQESMAEDFEETNQDWLQSRLDNLKLESTFSWSFSELLKNSALLALITYIGMTYIDGFMGYSVGTIFVLINYVSRLFDPVTQIVRMMTVLQQALVSGSRVLELMDTPPEEDTDLQIKIEKGDVEFKEVYFAYVPGEDVLKNINLSVKQGQTVGLIGHTGSGKSSIINLLFRFYNPQSGQITIDDQSILDKNRESVRSEMGIVLQEPYLFSGTIASNISMNDESITEAEIIDALEKVGAKEMISKLAKGIYEPVREKGQTFSSGERQLISFARTLASNPKILILDEATSHIDTETEEIIQHAMDVVKEGRTTFIIAHRLSTIQNADQIILLDAGEIKEQGTHEELMTLNGAYAEMFYLQTKVAQSS